MRWILKIREACFMALLSFPLPSSATDARRDPAMEVYGPTEILSTVESPKTSGPINWDLSYVGDLGRNFQGGIRTGGSFIGVASARTHIDLDKGMGLRGSKLFFNLMAIHGTVQSYQTGDFQIASSIESYTDTIRLMEGWYKQEFASGKAFVLFGLLDMNSEFYVNETAMMFLNSSFGLGTEIAQLDPSGRAAPTFPLTSLTALLKFEPTQNTYVDLAAFDALPGHPQDAGTQIKYDPKGEGHLFIGDVGYSRRVQERAEEKYAIGAWIYDQPFKSLSDTSTTGPSKGAASYGAYFISEKKIASSMYVFGRYGAASGDANRFKDNFAFGVTFEGLVPKREKDTLGIGVTSLTTGDQYLDKLRREGRRSERSETVYELTYRATISKHLFIQPDLQYIVNPNARVDLKDSLIGFVRIQMQLN